MISSERRLVLNANNIYGQLRGYHRLSIRRAVAANAKLPAEQLMALNRKLFLRRVRRAINDFPLYADKVQSSVGKQLGNDLEIDPTDLPVWTRSDQNKLMESMEGPPCGNSFLHSTGGSTGVPMRFYVTRESYEWRAAVSDRGYSWAGGEDGKKRFYVWGSSITPPGFMKRTKSRIEDCIKKRRYFDSFYFDEKQKTQCCEQINRYKPDSIVGYAGNLVELARFVKGNPGVLKWKSKSAITAAEGIHPGQRELIEGQITDELFLSYGSREFMLIGMECVRHAGYHISADSLLVEVVDNEGKPVQEGETGRILVTDLRNDANPFIRYEIGDMGTYTANQCDCGLPFPLLASVDGRIQEIIYKPDGSKLTALFIPHLMKEFKWIDGYQIRQEEKESITVNIIAGSDFTEEICTPVKTALYEKLGKDMKVDFRVVSSLEKSKSGKTPIVIQRIVPTDLHG